MESKLMWAAIGGLYVWQFWHGRSCMDWRAHVAQQIGEIRGRLGLNAP